MTRALTERGEWGGVCAPALGSLLLRTPRRAATGEALPVGAFPGLHSACGGGGLGLNFSSFLLADLRCQLQHRGQSLELFGDPAAVLPRAEWDEDQRLISRVAGSSRLTTSAH